MVLSLSDETDSFEIHFDEKGQQKYCSDLILYLMPPDIVFHDPCPDRHPACTNCHSLRSYSHHPGGFLFLGWLHIHKDGGRSYKSNNRYKNRFS